MSGEDAEQNKSEQASPYKLQKAREKGAVARGTDLGFLTATSAFIGYAWIAGPAARTRIAEAAERAIVAAGNVVAGPNELMAVTGAVLASAVRPLAFMAATVFVVVLVFEMAQLRGFVFSTEPLKIQFNRLNPAQNLKRLFSLRILLETGKNILKMATYLTLVWWVIRHAHQTNTPAIDDARDLVRVMAQTALKLMVVFSGAAVVFAAMDQFITRRDFSKKMRMSRREVRREHRDREGEPRMKQKRKQLHAEFVKMSQSLRGVRGADILVTNPTHYAVALRYDGAAMTAPKVVSLGADHFALRLKRLAFLYGVTIVQNRELARALYARCQLNSEIPEALYQPVADLYTAMRGGNGKTRNATAHA